MRTKESDRSPFRDHVLDKNALLTFAPHSLPMLLETKAETRLATLEWHTKNILLIRFKRELPMDLAGVEEVLSERVRMCSGCKVGVLVVLPEDMDADIRVSVTDHGVWVDDITFAEATVGPLVYQTRMADLYYAHFPQSFPTAIFTSEEEALAWLERIMEGEAGE